MAEDDKGEIQDGEKTAENSEDPDPFSIALSETEEDLEKLKGEEKEEKVDDSKKLTQELSEKTRTLEEKLARLESDKSNLKKALHEERQSKKKAKLDESEGATLTDGELAKIIEEHKEDPAVLLNAVTYKMNQLLKKGKAEAVDEVEVKQKKDVLDRLLQERYGDALADDAAPIRQSINKAKEYLGLTDHPYGEHLGAAAVVFAALPQILKTEYEKGVKDQLDGKAEKNRKASIDAGKLNGGGKKNDAPVDSKTGLTESQLETAKRLGLASDPKKLKIFKSQILKTSAA